MHSKNWRHTDQDTVLLRHAQYVTEHLESRKEVLATQARAERVAFYSRQLGNIRAALEWSFGPHGGDEIATRLAAASTQLFLELSLLIECQVWAERAITAPWRSTQELSPGNGNLRIIVIGADALGGKQRAGPRRLLSGARHCGRYRTTWPTSSGC